MKKILSASICVALTACSVEPQVPTNGIQDSLKAKKYFSDLLEYTTNVSGVKKVVLDPNSKIVIIGLRAEKDYKADHIPKSINLAFDKYNTFEGNETEFPGLKRDAYNYVYCYDGTCKLAEKAANKFASLGYPVKIMIGGYTSWKEHKYPLKK